MIKLFFVLVGTSTCPILTGKLGLVNENNYLHKTSEKIIKSGEDMFMEQVVECNTRGENILDLFFTTHPTLVKRTKTLPPLGKGDHDIVLCDTLITPNRVKKPRRNILLWRKADEDGIKTALIKSQTDIIDNSNDVNKTWDIFRTTIEDIMKKYIPTKSTSTRNSHPWINRNINKLTRKKKPSTQKSKIHKEIKRLEPIHQVKISMSKRDKEVK